MAGRGAVSHVLELVEEYVDVAFYRRLRDGLVLHSRVRYSDGAQTGRCGNKQEKGNSCKVWNLAGHQILLFWSFHYSLAM